MRDELSQQLGTYMRDLDVAARERDAARATLRQTEADGLRARERIAALESAAAAAEAELGTLRVQAAELEQERNRSTDAVRDREVLTLCVGGGGVAQRKVPGRRSSADCFAFPKPPGNCASRKRKTSTRCSG